MFPVCAGIEIALELVELAFHMFPVCAGIEIRRRGHAQPQGMFPVCAGIETIAASSEKSTIYGSRVCGN